MSTYLYEHPLYRNLQTPEGASDFLPFGLQVVIATEIGAGNWTQVQGMSTVLSTAESLLQPHVYISNQKGHLKSSMYGG